MHANIQKIPDTTKGTGDGRGMKCNFDCVKVIDQ